MKLEFSRRVFEKNTETSNLVQIRLVGADLSHADLLTDRQTDIQTDMTKLRVPFRSFANAPKMEKK
jgi:hypothetical protein